MIIGDLLALWSALAAVSRRPGRVQVMAASGGATPDFGVHPVPTLVVSLQDVVRIERPGRSAIDLVAGDALVVAPGAAHRHAPLRRTAMALELGFDYGWCDIEIHDAAATRIAATTARQPAEELMSRLLSGDGMALGSLLLLLLERPMQYRQLPEAALRMRSYIRSHGLTPITAADVAGASGLAPSRAWQVFREHFGCTPRQALERRRCLIAAALRAQGVAVGEVATQCGFRDRGTFTRAFARMHAASRR